MMKNSYYEGPVSNHYNGQVFFNLHQPSTTRSLNGWKMIRWSLSTMMTKWVDNIPHAIQTRPKPYEDGLKVTMIGHASFLLQIEGTNILVDPVWSNRVGPLFLVGKKRYNPPGVAFSKLPHIDAVLITHNHYDHMDIRTLKRLYKRYKPTFFVPLGNDTILKKHISSKMNTQSMDWFDRSDLCKNISITLWPAYHWSARWLSDRNMALWGGFVIQSPNYSVYCTGDTAYGDGDIFKDLAKEFPNLDLAVINLGAYAPRTFLKSHHNDPAEAVKIFQDCGAKYAVGIHWGTFHLSSEGPYEPVHSLYSVLRDHLLSVDQFIPLRPGRTWNVKGETSDPVLKDHSNVDEPLKA